MNGTPKTKTPCTPHLACLKPSPGSTGFAKTFESILKAYPKTTFIGHADAFWANVSEDYHNEAAYPSGPVRRGGVTDRWLGDYANLFGGTTMGIRAPTDLRPPALETIRLAARGETGSENHAMSIDDFVRYSKVLHRLTADFARAVPDDKWDFTPDPPGRARRAPAPHRIGDGFAPFCKQLRHVICVRGIYNAALATKHVDWTRKHEHYAGPLTREALLAALDDTHRDLLSALKTVDIEAPIDWDGTPFTFALFTWEFVQHEALHHGQWSVYAALAGFDTPSSWRESWGL